MLRTSNFVHYITLLLQRMILRHCRASAAYKLTSGYPKLRLGRLYFLNLLLRLASRGGFECEKNVRVKYESPTLKNVKCVTLR